MQSRHFEAIIFSAKAAVATMVSALCCKFFLPPGAAWVAAVSAVLVTQPDLHSSFKASFMRVVANLMGAFGGAALLAATGQPVTAMAIGVLATGLACYLLKQDDALRPVFVAVIIGCGCALVVGFLFDKLSGVSKLLKKGDGEASTSE